MQVLPGLVTLGLHFSLEEAALQEAKRPLRLSINGCIILQALLGMPQTACARISDAIADLPSAQIGYLAKDPSGARVLEAVLKVQARFHVLLHKLLSHMLSVVHVLGRSISCSAQRCCL